VAALSRPDGIRANAVESFGADTAWMSRVAAWGDLLRVPGFLYRKRYHDRNVHTRWQQWPEAKRFDAWATHCADMLDEAMRVDAELGERRLLWIASVTRLTSDRLGSGYLPRGFAGGPPGPLLDRFMELLTERGSRPHEWLRTSRWRLTRWTRRLSRAPGPLPDLLEALRYAHRRSGARLPPTIRGFLSARLPGPERTP
jgi:hypothetical protein